MLHRPLIPFLLALIGGIVVSYSVLSVYPSLSVSIALFLILSVSAILFLSPRLKLFCLVLVFFFTGVLLERGKHTPSQFIKLAVQRLRVTIEGTVLEPIQVIEDIARLKVRAHTVFLDGKTSLVNENLHVSVYNHIPPIKPGQRIRFPAKLRAFKNFNNPGRYDYERAMKLRGFACAASVSDGRLIVPMGEGNLPFPRSLIERIQRPVREFFAERPSVEDSALFRALILGERQDIDPDLREPFYQTGLGHILAVSGLHIGLIAWISFYLIRWILSYSYTLCLKVDVRKLAALLTCLPIIAYTFLAGFQVSSQRALIMALTFFCSLILGKEKELWSTLALAALLILALEPHAIFTISFQLSFSAVIGILWLTPPLLNTIFAQIQILKLNNRILNRLLTYLIGLITVSVSATVFLLPLTSFYFHRVSFVSIPANLTVVPVLGLWVLPCGLLSAVALPFSYGLASFFLKLGAWGLNGMMELIRFWADLPWSSFWIVTPNQFEIILFYLLILSIFYCKRRPWAKMGILIIAAVFLGDICYWAYKVKFNNQLKVTFLDVGQASSALIEFPNGKKMLVDGGGFPRDHFDVGRMVIAPFLWGSKIQHIDYMVLSHPQADHMNGLRFIAKAFNPKEFWYNGQHVEKVSFRELMNIIESKKIKKRLPANLKGVREINGVRIEVLHPRSLEHAVVYSGSGTKLNNNSLVLKISYGEESFLFPGDLEREGEKVLISNSGDSLKSDVLLSPHHGSHNSNSREFLEMVQPRICVISSGEGNFFGFPHRETLKRLRDIGCKIIRIDQSGAVQFRARPHQLEMNTFMKSEDS